MMYNVKILNVDKEFKGLSKEETLNFLESFVTKDWLTNNKTNSPKSAIKDTVKYYEEILNSGKQLMATFNPVIDGKEAFAIVSVERA